MARRHGCLLSSTPGIVSAVEPGSIAEVAGIEAGDLVHSVNGHLLRDIIDYRFYTAEEKLALLTSREGRKREYEISRGYDQELGIDFEAPTFDGIRRCQCRCAFCFVHQMPPGLRRSLYIRDDDFRYSFLFGNFVTLTNLSREDWQRIEEQRLSPLYVSVHATDLELRRQILGCPSAPDIIAQIRGLGRAGIEVHSQIVLVPGLNDGEILTRSIQDLGKLFPTVASIAVVPVGLTRYHRRGLARPTATQAHKLAGLVTHQQDAFRQATGRSLVYLADEVYLQAGLSVPASEFYDDYPHLENGVGLTRQLLNEWDELRPQASTIRPSYSTATVVCGTLIGPTLDQLLMEVGHAVGVRYATTPVSNRFFGESTNVSGLLTGRDVVQALRRRELGNLVILPRVMFDASGRGTLDDLALENIAEELGAPVFTASTIEQMLLA